MKNQRNYSKELKEEAIKMIIKDGLSHAEVSNRLGIPKGTIGGWIKLSFKVHTSNCDK